MPQSKPTYNPDWSDGDHLLDLWYKCYTELLVEPLSKLGLDRCRVRNFTLDLNTHSIQYATTIMNTSRRLKNIKERTHGSFHNPPDPH